jgi:hypothetical protein
MSLRQLKDAWRPLAGLLACCASSSTASAGWDWNGILEKESAIPAGQQFDWVRNLTFPGPGDWKPIYLAVDGSEISFGTLRNSTRRGEVARVWVRVEYRDRKQHQSSATFTEFDCEDHTMRFLSQRQFSESDMRGELRTINSHDIAEPILPGTAAETWLEWACKATGQSTAERVIPDDASP